jgi:hypothetical protein
MYRLKLIRQAYAALAAAVMMLSMAANVHAHATNLWCYVENGRVYVEGSFMGTGRKVQNGQVIVVDGKGEKALEGQTDKEGKFDFAPPYKGDMTILLRVDQAHDAEFELTEQDFLDAEAEAKSAAEQAK